MYKTTLYLTPELKAAVERAASERQCSMADIVRDALRAFTAAMDRPKPRLPLFDSRQPGLAEDVEAALGGFGDRDVLT